jgi:hypothetical protein
MLTITSDNYYSKDADKEYMSVSQFKDFVGSQEHYGCEAAAMGKIDGSFEPQVTTPLLVGSYIDAYFEGTVDQFKDEHPELICKTGAQKGQLKADYRQADEIIKRIESDKLFSAYMAGEKQIIMTGDLFGTKWKIKMDSYHPNDKIVDLKIMQNIEPVWSDRNKRKVDFIHYWGYDLQGAIYQKIVEQNTGKKLPFYIAVATKEKPSSNIEVIEVSQPQLDAALSFIETNMPRVLAVKNRRMKPHRCGKCAYCLETKVLEAPIKIEDIMLVKEETFEDFE